MQKLFGRLAVHYGMIDMGQLAEATRLQARHGDGRMLGQILVELDLLDLDQLNQILLYQREYLEQGASAEGPLDESRLPREAAKPSPAPPAESPGVKLGAVRARRTPTEGAGRPLTGALPPLPGRTAKPSPPPPPPAGPDLFSAADFAEPIPAELSVASAEDWITPSELLALAPVETCLREAVSLGASDVHAHAGNPLRMRLNGRLVRYGQQVMAPAELERSLMTMLEAHQRARLSAAGHVDFIYDVPEVGRFRANVFRQRDGLDGVFRLIPATPPTLAALGLPREVARLTNFSQGLVLVTGPSGCGKTSTLAALVDLLNEERCCHILTIEDPIEYQHRCKRAVVNQRQVGPHTRSAARALRAALREDPDVIVVGELRDRESIELALSAAETGHLVLGTLHTAGVINSIRRLQGAFPHDQQGHVRSLLADTLRAVLTQRLVRTARDEGRILAHGLLMMNPAVGALVREGKLHQLRNVMQTGQSSGSALLDDTLARLLKAGTITAPEARRHAIHPTRFDSKEA